LLLSPSSLRCNTIKINEEGDDSNVAVTFLPYSAAKQEEEGDDNFAVAFLC
jgi:hypothetical protein